METEILIHLTSKLVQTIFQLREDEVKITPNSSKAQLLEEIPMDLIKI